MSDQELMRAIETISKYVEDANKGLPEELFLLVSSLTPIPNVDLLIKDDAGNILLSWRDDEYYGKGWHLPGGCIRFGETMESRIQKTAVKELGCTVRHDLLPIAIRDVLRGPKHNLNNPNARGHNITILFRCWLPDYYSICNDGRSKTDSGYLKWFDHIPHNLLHVHSVYGCLLLEC